MRKRIFFLIQTVGIVILFLSFFTTRVAADYQYDYYDFDEMVDLLESLEAESLLRSPTIFMLQTLGYTSMENPIYAVKFSDNPGKEENDEPVIVIDGGIHSSEWITVESCLNFTKYLFNTYYDESHPEHGEVVNLIKDFEIWIIPMINPDGRTRDDTNSGDPEQYWTSTEYHPTILDKLYSDASGWRCNLQEVDCLSMPEGKTTGIDPNRVFSYDFWEHSDCTIQTYNGGSPFSAVEAKVLKQFINNHMVSFVWHQHSPLAAILPASGRTGLGAWISHEVIKLYSVGMPYPALALINPYETLSNVNDYSSEKSYGELLSSEESICGGGPFSGQYQTWLWGEVNCELAPDNRSYRAIQGILFEYPFSDQNYGVPEDGKAGQYMRGDASNIFHPSSGEVVEWLLDKSVEIYKYLIKQAQYPFSPRYYTDMTSLRPEAPETDLALVGAKISEVGKELPGCFTYSSEGRDILESGKKRITWKIQNNGTDTRTITSTVKICNETEDPECTNKIEEVITKEIVPPEKIETFEYDFQFEGGKDYLVELSTGESNLLKNDLKRFVFTTAEPSNICPAGLLTGYNPKKMHLLRQFRDNFLNKSKTGRQYIQWYYDHANELQSILINNPSIRLVASRMIDKVLSTIGSISSEKYLFNEQILMVDFMELCSAAIAKASPEMGTVIKKIQQIHKEGNFGSAVTR